MASLAQYVLASGLFLVLFLFANSESNPCANYFPINEPKRSTQNILNGEKAICDSELTSGWYRFTMAKEAHIPTTEPGTRHCGTLAPIWINGTHPDTEGGEVLAVACAKIDNGTKRCMYQHDVRIKNCGDFYVYFLQSTPARCMAYCAEFKDEQIQEDFRGDRKARSATGSSCNSKKNTCLINDKCYSGNDVNPNNWCQKCMPDVRNDTWTTRNDNRPPTFGAGQGIMRIGVVGESLPLQLNATDPNNRPITFSLLSPTAKSGFSLSSSGLLLVNVTAKIYDFTVSVKDECNATDKVTFKVHSIPCKCKNGGHCLPKPSLPRGSGHYICKCLQGFSGPICENNICQTVYCGNGTCIAGVNNYTCQCHDGFKGSKCDQIIHKCTNQSCFAGVQCTETGSGISCGPCPNGMTGDGKTCTALPIPGLHTTTAPVGTTQGSRHTTTSVMTAAMTNASTTAITTADATTAAPATTSPPATTNAGKNSTTTAPVQETTTAASATTKRQVTTKPNVTTTTAAAPPPPKSTTTTTATNTTITTAPPPPPATTTKTTTTTTTSTNTTTAPPPPPQETTTTAASTTAPPPAETTTTAPPPPPPQKTTTTATTTTQPPPPPPVTTTTTTTTTTAPPTTTTTRTTTQPPPPQTTARAPTTKSESTTTRVTAPLTEGIATTHQATEKVTKNTATEKPTPTKEKPTEEIPIDKLYVVGAEITILSEWKDEYRNNESDDFKNLKKVFTKAIEEAYEKAGDKNFYKVFDITFRQGSVIADFKLAFVNKTSQPLEVMKSAVKNGELNELKIDPESLKQKNTDTGAGAKPKERGTNLVLIVILVILAALIIVVIAVTCYIRKKNKRKMDMNNHGKEDGTPAETIPLTEKNSK